MIPAAASPVSSLPSPSISTEQKKPSVVTQAALDTLPAVSPETKLTASGRVFSYNDQTYIVKKTKGQGSCAIHALLGTQIDGEYQFEGGDDASKRAKTHFTHALRTALDNDTTQIEDLFTEIMNEYLGRSSTRTFDTNACSIQDFFVEAMSAYLGRSLQPVVTDTSAKALFCSSAIGREMQNHCKMLRDQCTAKIAALDLAQSHLWRALFLMRNNQVFTAIMAALPQKDNKPPYISISGRQVPKILLDNPLLILNIVNTNPNLLLALLDPSSRAPIPRTQIEHLRREKEQALKELEAAERAFFLSPSFIEHYIATILVTSFYLTTQELKLAAYLFEKKVQIVALQDAAMQPAEDLINSALSGEPLLIYHEGVHFSRCDKQLVAPAVATVFSQTLPQAIARRQIPFYLDNARNTRSNVMSLPEMTVTEINRAEGTITLQFPSHTDFETCEQRMATYAAERGLYALAHRLATPGTVQATRWTEKALRATAAAIANEPGKTELARRYNEHAEALAANLKDRQARFDEAIRQLKEGFLNKAVSLAELWDHFYTAKELCPENFEPYYFLLLLAKVFSLFNPEEARVMIQEAYNVSPLLTFNVLIGQLLLLINAKDKNSDNIKNFLGVIVEQFPNDRIFSFIAKRLKIDLEIDAIENAALTETEQGEAFCTHLGEALTAVREGDLEEAYSAFSAANQFNISDKRPYMYRALIDLQNGNLSSFKKQTLLLTQTLNWFNKDTNAYLVNFILQKLTSKTATPAPVSTHAATSVLQTLFAVFNTKTAGDKEYNAFFLAMESYLKDDVADYVWAGLALDVARQKIDAEPMKGITVSYSTAGYVFVDMETEPLSLMKLNRILATKAFVKLHHLNPVAAADAKELVHFEGERPIFTPTVVLSFPPRAKHVVCINPKTLEVDEASQVPLLDDIVFERCNDFGNHFVMRHCIAPAKFIAILTELGADDVPLYPPFLFALLEKLEKEGALHHKIALFQWLTAHPKKIPEGSSALLSQTATRWLLDQPIPLQGVEHLLEASKSFIVSAEEKLTAASPAHAIAYRGWAHLQHRELKQAQETIDLFFNHWEEKMMEGVDEIALQTLCLTRTLLEQQRFIMFMPKAPINELHGSVIGCAFTLLAREGVMRPFAVPDRQMSRDQLRTLGSFYLGIKKGEDEKARHARLVATRFHSLADIRVARKVTHLSEPVRPEKDWVQTFKKLENVEGMSSLIEEAIELQEYRLNHQKSITGEKPSYPANGAFISWVKTTRNLVQRYIRDPEAIKRHVNSNYPSLTAKGRATFFEELESKSKHEVGVNKLREEFKAFKDPHKRFWQVVEQTAELIARVQGDSRANVEYDMLLGSQEEASFVMKLLYEWNQKEQALAPDKELTSHFHGPEIHVWGKGPRLSHYNAGIFNGRSFSNVHLYF